MENKYEFIKDFFDHLILGDASIITSENILKLNNLALEIYGTEILDEEYCEILRLIIMSCNILYNRTDMTVLPIEDGFYDLLLEKYKVYNPNFQVGSAVVEFRNFIENDLDNPVKIATCPIIIEEKKDINRNEIRQQMYDSIMKKVELNIHDYAISPIEFDNSLISKRTHNTEHNHPDLVGTLDKCKFVFIKDAIDAGAIDDPNVKILERDFFYDHIEKGIIDPNRVINVVCELKYDGISVEADCGLQVESARTRGDTGIGAASDISPILQGYTFKQAKCMIGEKPIGVKFEAIITKSNLYRFNELRGRTYKNCRSAIVGLFGSSDAYLYRDMITLIPLALDRNDAPYITNRKEEIEFLNRVFISNGEPLRYCYMSGTVSEILYMIKAFWDEAKIARDYLDFMYDGIVVSYLDEDIRQKLGRKNFINKYSMAVKFDPIEKQTIFRGYSYEVGQHGQITPMIHYDPVEFIGTIHTKSTGSSFDRFSELNLRYGDYINVTYVNDVMPYVSKLECEHNRKNAETRDPERFIEVCPVCGSKLVLSSSGKTYLCPNIQCTGRSIQRMSNMLQKLNIKGFSDASIIALNVTHLYELVNLSDDYIKQRIGEANGQSLINAINIITREPIKDYIVMGSLGFTSMAHKKWKLILQQISLSDLYNLYISSKSEEEFRNKLITIVADLGEVTSLTISTEFKFFEKDILEILNTFNIVSSFGVSDDKLQIRFSGYRNKQLSELLCNAGYDADDSSGVTKKTNILLIPYEGFTSSKVNKAPESCKVIPIDTFINNIRYYLDDEDLINQILGIYRVFK